MMHIMHMDGTNERILFANK